MAARDEIIRLLIEAAGAEDIDALTEALDRLEDQAEGGGEAAQALVDELDKLSTATKAAGELVGLKAAVADTEVQLGKARDRLAELNTTYSETEKQTKGVAREFLQAERAVAGLEDDLNKQNLALQRMGGALSKAGVDVSKLVSEEARMREEAVKAAQALRHNESAAEANARAAERNAAALKQMGEAFARARDRVGDIATKLTAAGAAAAAAAAAFAAYKTGQFFTESIKEAAEFEAQISEIAAVSGATGAELQKLSDAARNAALNTGEQFGSVTATLGELVRAVGDADRAVAMLGPTLDLASAGGLETAQSAEILTTTLTQFGLAAADATRVADVLANGANVTTASVEQLGNSLSYAAPLARQLDMSLEDTVAAIGALADEGFRGERAGTALRNVMSALADPTSKFSEALDKVGIEARDFNGVIAGLAASGDKAKTALLSLDAAARPAITALVNSGGEGIARLRGEFEKMEVTAASAAEVMRSNLQGAASQAQVAFANLRQQLVQPLLEPITRELQAAGIALREFAESPEFAQIQTALATLFDAGIEGAREFLGTIDWADLGQRITTFAEGASAKLAEFSASSGETIGYLREIFNAFGIVLDSVQTGIFGIAAAVAKLAQVGAEVSILYLELQRLNPAAQMAAKAVGVDLAGAVEHLTEVSGGMGAVYDEFADRTSKNFNELRDGLDRIGQGLEAAADKAPPAGDEIAEGLEPAVATIQMVNEQLEFVGDAIEDAVDASAGAGQQISDDLAPAQSAAEALEQAFQRLRISSQAELQATAARAATDFATIEQAARSGAATIGDVRAAFEVYARAQLAAAANMDSAARAQVESMLRIKGGAIGATEALERLRLAGPQSTQPIPGSAGNAEVALQGLADAADTAGGSLSRMGDSAENAGDQLDGLAAAAKGYGASLGEMSQEAAAAYESMNKWQDRTTSGGANFRREMNRLTQVIQEQRDAYRAEMEQLERNAAANDELAHYLDQVAQKYNYLSENQQRALAEARMRADQAAAANSAENASINAGNEALRERNALLEKQQQQTVTQRKEVDVRVSFEAKASKVQFDLSDISDSQMRQLAQRLMSIIERERV